MLVKIDNKWLRADLITCLEVSRGSVNGSIGYILLARGVRRDYLCGEYETEAEVVKAMDEAAEKINAAQGFKPAAEQKAVMEYTASGTESKRGTFRCSHCGFVVLGVSAKFCPGCGRGIVRWEE